MINMAFYDAKAYDRPSFEHYGSLHDIQFRFLETKLNEDTAELARGCEVVCVFVNDSVDKAVIDRLYGLGVKLIALRSAGYNNVDVKAAFGKIHVVHVPAYSPYAVAEHAMALLLTSVREARLYDAMVWFIIRYGRKYKEGFHECPGHYGQCPQKRYDSISRTEIHRWSHGGGTRGIPFRCRVQERPSVYCLREVPQDGIMCIPG